VLLVFSFWSPGGTVDVSKPRLRTLPYEELMAKLHSATNLQVVEDPGSPTGRKLEVDPYRAMAGRPPGDDSLRGFVFTGSAPGVVRLPQGRSW